MLNEEKIKQVRKQLRTGIPQGEIENELIKEGYTEEDIKKIFIPHRSDMRSWYLFFAIRFLLICLYTVVVNNSFLFLLFSAGLFFVYDQEIKRPKRSSS